MKELLLGTSKIILSRSAKFALVAFATLAAAGLAGACGSDSTPAQGDAGSGASSGHSGAASGSTSGGSAGSASGAAMGDAGDGGNDGAAGDDSGGDADGPAFAPYVAEMCTSACMMATGCPTPNCYAASANPIPNPATAGVPENLLYPKYAHDGDPATRYSTGQPAVGMEWFQVDLCRTASVSGVTLDDTSNPGDQAASYTVQVSLDGTTWTPVAMGSSIPLVDASVAVPDSSVAPDSSAAMDSSPPGVDAGVPVAAPAVLTIPFAPVMARYVRVNQTGTLPTSARTGMPRWWSIDEFSVACPGGGGDSAPASDSSSDVALDVASQ